jgi:hypothetical protein
MRRRAAALAALSGLALVPVASAPPAHATHCAPGTRLFTAAPLPFPRLGVASTEYWTATCGSGNLEGDCFSARDIATGGTIFFVPDYENGESCTPFEGAQDFVVATW